MTKLRLKSKSFYYSAGLRHPNSHKRLGQSLTTCHVNIEAHLGLQRSHCRKNFLVTWFPPNPWSYHPALLSYQGQEIPTAFSHQPTPKLCVSLSQFTAIRDAKSPENFKKWWNVMNWREKKPQTLYWRFKTFLYTFTNVKLLISLWNMKYYQL